MKTDQLSFMGIPSHLLLGVFNLALGYSIASHPLTRIGTFFAEFTALPQELVSMVLALVMMVAGVYLITFAPRGNRFAFAAMPTLFYNLATGVVVLRDPTAPAGGTIISLFMLFYLWQNFEMGAERRASEEYIQQKAAEIVALKARNAELEAAAQSQPGQPPKV